MNNVNNIFLWKSYNLNIEIIFNILNEDVANDFYVKNLQTSLDLFISMFNCIKLGFCD